MYSLAKEDILPTASKRTNLSTLFILSASRIMVLLHLEKIIWFKNFKKKDNDTNPILSIKQHFLVI